MNRQVIGGLGIILISLGSPVYAQNIELPPREKLECIVSPENLVAHYTQIPDLYNSRGKTIMRYMNKNDPSENKPRCGMMYEIDEIKPYGTGIIILYKKGVKIDGDK